MPSPACATKTAPAAHPAEVSTLINFLVGGAGDAGVPAVLRVADSIGPRLADGEGRYRLLRVIGRGSWSIVYEASDRLLATESSEALVAVKVARCDRRPDAERELDEARQARRVEHPNVVRVLDCGLSDEGSVFTVLELVEGHTLEQHVVRRPRAPRRELVGLLVQAARGLEAIHAAGLVHCDIKPSNLLLARDGSVRIADFGAAARQTRKPPLADPSTPDARGTLAFMAPEQFRLERGALTPSSDIFSLGATLFWLLTGEAVAGSSALEAVGALADSDGLDMEQVGRRLRAAGVDRQLRAITTRALAPDQQARYASAGVLAADLSAWIARRPVEWTRPGMATRVALLCRRRPFAAAGFALALLAGAAAAAAHADARRLAAENAAREAELEIERAERNAETAWRKRSLDSLMRLMAGFRAAKEQGLAAEVLTSLWVLEWAHGPTLLQDPAATGEIWATRIEVLQSVRERAISTAGPDSIEARLTEPSLALWLLRDGRPAEAQALLADAIDYWERRTTPSDPWLAELRVLDSAAAVLSARERGRDPASPDDGHRAAEHEAALVAARESMIAAGKSGPLATLVSEVLDNR